MQADFFDELRSLETRCPPGVSLAGRTLRPDTSPVCVADRDVASRAAREAAAQLLRQKGVEADIPPSELSTPPRFPAGIVGSLAHDGEVAVAAIAQSDEMVAIGIDVEPSEGLPPECLQAVATLFERRRLANLVEARLLFCAKEAVFKAVNASGGPWLEHHDVEVDLERERALANGHLRVSLRLEVVPPSWTVWRLS